MRVFGAGTIVAVVVGAIVSVACATTRKVPKPDVVPVSEAPRCRTQLTEINITTWREITHAGVRFCVPPDWRLDERAERVTAQRANRAFRTLSWYGPDSSQRVTIDIPLISSTREGYLLEAERCLKELVLGDLEACPVSAGYVTILITHEPPLRITIKGTERTLNIANTFRPALPTGN